MIDKQAWLAISRCGSKLQRCGTGEDAGFMVPTVIDHTSRSVYEVWRSNSPTGPASSGPVTLKVGVMDRRTGEIFDNLTDKQINEIGHLIGIDTGDMTEKQRKTKQVSKHDNRSKLGKLYTECRRVGWSNLSKNQRRNLRNKLGLK